MSVADFLQKLGIGYPIIQGPMGGGPSTPELVAAVSNAGGMGSLGAAYLAPEKLVSEIKKIKALTGKSFNLNLFVAPKPSTFPDPQPMLDMLGEIHQRLKIPSPTRPVSVPDPFPAQFEAMLVDKPAIFSFTFGIPDKKTIERLKAEKIYVIGTATTVEEALSLEKAGIDAIVIQGEEAGAHRGTFLQAFETSMIPTMELLQQTLKAVSIPVIASGGLMDGRDITKVLDAGAAAAQLGTAFLPCPETGAPEVHKKAILAAKEDTTDITYAFSGRAARGLRNEFMKKLENRREIILPFPQQNALTRLMRTAAAEQDNAEYLSLWAGRGVARARQMPAAELIGTLVDEMNATRS